MLHKLVNKLHYSHILFLLQFYRHKKALFIKQRFSYWLSGYCFTSALPAIVMPPVLVKPLPSKLAPVLNVIDCIAKIVPFITDVVPKVAELPTCQKILEAEAPPLKITLRPDVVVSVDAICMIKTALAFPFASKVRSPDDMASEEVDL